MPRGDQQKAGRVIIGPYPWPLRGSIKRIAAKSNSPGTTAASKVSAAFFPNALHTIHPPRNTPGMTPTTVTPPRLKSNKGARPTNCPIGSRKYSLRITKKRPRPSASPSSPAARQKSTAGPVFHSRRRRRTVTAAAAARKKSPASSANRVTRVSPIEMTGISDIYGTRDTKQIISARSLSLSGTFSF